MSLEKERVEALQRVIDELRDEPGALMPIMQRAQDIFGYLPEDVQKYIAKEMDIPVSDFWHFHMGNCATAILECREGKLSLLEYQDSESVNTKSKLL